MADIGTLTITLGVDDSGLLQARARVNEFVKDIQNKVPKITPALTEPFQLFSKQAIGHIALVSQRIRTFGYLASAAITAPMVLAGKSVMSMASDYEFAMQKIVGLTGTAQSVVNDWSKDIEGMAKSFGRNPKELAEGLYFIASSGIQGAQALDVLEKSAKAAATGLSTTQEVANYLTSVLNAYRGTGLTAAYATDVLVAAVREGKAEASGFAAAMGSLTPIASNLGVSIDQVAGAMAGITLTGSTAAQAATYLRGVFNVLMKETKQGAVAMDEASAALGQMNTSYADLRKILREQGIMALMEKLNELTAGYGETLVSKVFPNIRAMLGVLSLSGKNMKYNSGIMKEITESSGALGKAFAAVSDTIKLRYDRAISGMQVSMISLGKQIATALIPFLEWVAEKLNKLAKWFDSLTEAQKKNKVMWAVIVAAAGPALLVFSTLGYTLTFLLSIINGVGKALVWLSQVLTGTKVSMVAAEVATTSFGAKLLTLGKSAKTIGMFLAKNPAALLITGLVAGGVAIGRYAKKIREIAEENKLFNHTMVDIGETMKRFGDLSMGDIKGMSLEELTKTREQARKVWEESYKYYQQYEKNLDSKLQSDRLNKKLMAESLKEIEHAKMVYDEAGKSIENYAESFSAERMAEFAAEQDKVIEKTKEYKEALQGVWGGMILDVSSLEQMQKIYDELGMPFDVAEEKAKLFLQTIETLTGKEYKLKFDSWEIQTLLKWIKETKVDLSELGKITKQYNAELAAIDMKSLLLGPGFDAESARLAVYQQQLDSLIDTLSKKKPMDLTLADQQQVEEQLRLIDRTKQGIESMTDANTLRLLQAEADAFGNIAGQVEVLNYAIQAEERHLRSMLKVFTEGSKTGETVTWEQIQETTKRIQEMKSAYVDAQNAMDMQFLTDLDGALRNADTGADILSGRITSLERKLQMLSETGQGGTEMFKQLAQEMQLLTYAQEGVDLLSGAFNDLFQGMIDGSKNMGEILDGIFKQIISKILEMIAQLIAMRIMMAIIGGPLGAIGGSAGLGNIPPISPLIGGGALAFRGGIVPPGYPNDSYPARLSSGEAVVPLDNINNLNLQPTTAILEGEVVFEIGQDKLVGILRKADKRNSLY